MNLPNYFDFTQKYKKPFAIYKGLSLFKEIISINVLLHLLLKELFEE